MSGLRTYQPRRASAPAMPWATGQPDGATTDAVAMASAGTISRGLSAYSHSDAAVDGLRRGREA